MMDQKFNCSQVGSKFQSLKFVVMGYSQVEACSPNSSENVWNASSIISLVHDIARIDFSLGYIKILMTDFTVTKGQLSTA